MATDSISINIDGNSNDSKLILNSTSGVIGSEVTPAASTLPAEPTTLEKLTHPLSITLDQLNSKLNSHYVQVVDVRHPTREFSGCHIPNSINVPLLDNSGVVITTFVDDFKKHVHHGLETVILCRTGGRAFAATKLVIDSYDTDTSIRQNNLSFVGTGGVPDYLATYYPDLSLNIPPTLNLSIIDNHFNFKISPDIATILVKKHAGVSFEDMNLIDVRNKDEEFDKDFFGDNSANNNLPNTVYNVPLFFTDNSFDLGVSAEWVSTFQDKNIDLTKLTIMWCRSGRRAELAYEELVKNGLIENKNKFWIIGKGGYSQFNYNFGLP